jgi:MFS family permease
MQKLRAEPLQQSPSQILGVPLPKWLYYGWVVVAGSFICLAVAYTVSYSFSVFYVAILGEFGWTRASTALAYSIYLGVYGLSAPFTGALIDRFGSRKVIPTGAVVVALGLVACSTIAEPWQLYVYFGVTCGFGLNLIGALSHTSMLTNWFLRRRGTALGLAVSGIGVGVFAFVPFLQYVILTSSWRTAYVVLGVTVLLTIPAVGLLLYRQRPEEFGLLPDGGPTAAKPAAGGQPPRLHVVDAAWAARRWDVRSASVTGRFWLLFGCFVFGTLALQAVMAHQVAYLTDRRFDPFLAASVVGFLGLCSSVAKAAWGWASDRLGREVVYSLGLVCLVLGIVVLGLIGDASQAWAAYLYALAFGVGYGVYAPLMPAMAADIYQGPRFASVYGAIYVGTGIGSAFGPWLGGFIFDATGSYALLLIAACGAAAISIAAAWAAAPRGVRQVPGAVHRGPG